MTPALGSALAAQLRNDGIDVVTISAGTKYIRSSADAFAMAPANRADYDRLLADILARGKKLRRMIHLWNLSTGAAPPRKRRKYP